MLCGVSFVAKVVRAGGLVAVAALATASCADKGSSGVHAIVELDPKAFGAQTAYFDHVTVVAEAGGQRAVACFFPPDAPARQAEGGTGVADPCADLLAVEGPSPPTAVEWDLASAPRTVNFVFPDGQRPTITAFAALGAGGAIARATLDGPAASTGFPSVTVSLSPDVGGAPSCGIAFAPPGVVNSSQVCDAPIVAGCLEAAPNAARDEALACNGGVGRVTAGATVACSDGGAEARMVWREDERKPSTLSCAQVVVEGRFVRCASGAPSDPGGCPLTTDCDPPPTAIGYLNTNLPLQTQDVSCLPPSLVPRAFVVTFANVRKSDDTRAYPFLIAPEPASDPTRACFFDVQSIFVASGSQIPCPSIAPDAGVLDAGAPPVDASTHDAGTDASAHDGGTKDATK
jgi:hypothetical protein